MTGAYESSTGSCSWGDAAAPHQFRCSSRSNRPLPSSTSTSTGASLVVERTFRSASIRCKRRLHMDPSHLSDKHSWTAQEYAAFVDICWKLTRDGFRTRASLDDEGYRRLGEEFLERTGVSLRKSQFRHKWDNTKRDWKVYKKLRTLSGTGRDPVTGVVTAPDAWWDTAPLKYKKFKDVGLPYEEQLDFIFSGLSPACTRRFAGGTGAPSEYLESDTEGEPDLSAMVGSQMGGGSSSYPGVPKRRLAEFQAFLDIFQQKVAKSNSGEDLSTARNRPRQDCPSDGGAATTSPQYSSALQEVRAASFRGGSDEYIAAAELLQNPNLLEAYLQLPTTEEKIDFLRKMWAFRNK